MGTHVSGVVSPRLGTAIGLAYVRRGSQESGTRLEVEAGGVRHLAEVVGLPRQRLTVRNLLAGGQTSSNLVQYMQQTSRTNNAAVVTEGGTKPAAKKTESRQPESSRNHL